MKGILKLLELKLLMQSLTYYILLIKKNNTLVKSMLLYCESLPTGLKYKHNLRVVL